MTINHLLILTVVKFVVNRTDSTDEVGNQALYLPGIMPKFPGRLYYLFGRPIETKGTSPDPQVLFL